MDHTPCMALAAACSSEAKAFFEERQGLRPENGYTGYEEAYGRDTAGDESRPPASLNAEEPDYARDQQNEVRDERGELEGDEDSALPTG